MKRFFICSSVSCRERMFDCQKISNFLIRNNWLPINKASKADLIIINTCSFSSEEDDSSIDHINHYLKRKSKTAQIIIAGCMPVIDPNRLNRVGDFPTVTPTGLSKLDEMINSNVKFDTVDEPCNISSSEVSYRPILKKLLFCRSLLGKFNSGLAIKPSLLRKATYFVRNAAFLKSFINPFLVCNLNKFFYLRVSKGCLGKCSYCAKRFATGTLNSKLLKEIVAEFSNGLRANCKDFFLLSEDTGCYGLDIGTSIPELLKAIFKAGEGKDFKLIITNFNAQWFVKYYEELEDIFFHNQDKILYLQIPVQSGSSRILKLMNRSYNIEDVKVCLRKLKRKASSLCVTTDIIVGFPGETEEDFNKTRELMHEIQFNYADIFPYEDRLNTLANEMNDKIPKEIIEQRKIALMRIQNKNSSPKSIFKKIIEVSKSIDYL